MDTAYIWFLLGILGALIISGIQFYLKRSLTTKKIVEIVLLSLLVITVGFGSIWIFIGHAFLPNQVAAYIGWVPGSPFQLEVAFANLAFGVLGILCFWIRGNFWTASIIGFSIFYLGSAYGHIINILSTGNYAPGNAGAVLILDILIPILLIVLLFVYKVQEKRAMHSAIKSLERSL
jgi:hypothetical protein